MLMTANALAVVRPSPNSWNSTISTGTGLATGRKSGEVRPPRTNGPRRMDGQKMSFDCFVRIAIKGGVETAGCAHMSKDRPILFSGAMVRALLENRKSQTRRLAWRDCRPHESGVHERLPTVWQKAKPGDRLWARETWATAPMFDCDPPRMTGLKTPFWYLADGGTMNAVDHQPKPGKTRVSIHMPRWVSRLTLVVTDVRMQRLQEISEEDCLAEGPPNTEYAPGFLAPDETFIRTAPGLLATPRAWYRKLWDKINGKGAWDANPEVVALTFTVHQRNIDAMEPTP